ncbi:hypothetical protein [Mangrovibacterium diazotrophicum]|uniref:Uncharacterized protein n=1 Tax=Mangrovibacterium diazotrophicum TaxID=1261403 RepID=A0A419WAX3_9BACT|nr:hypothetical protein [Mangrovibacterium diazotrophicum]RKD92618.1 hypothetical protein BC643_2993 [Mangrovibacterium diazotrophicum]
MKSFLRLMKVPAIAIFVGLSLLFACETPMSESLPSDDLSLKKGGNSKSPANVEQGDLYGDLWELEREASGVPIQYELKYRVDYQDETVQGIIDVKNPRLNGAFSLTIVQRDEDGYAIYTEPTDGTDPVVVTEQVMITPNVDGFLTTETEFSPIALYDAEGEILSEAALHVYPIEEGRLNIIRSPSTVLANRMSEVIQNFGDGTVADVIRDYCGRLYMIRTDAALDDGIDDKPIDSPLENLAIYNELMINGLSKPSLQGGLKFLVEEEDPRGGFNFQSHLDSDWDAGPILFTTLSNDLDEQQFVANLAAACVAAGSDKSNFLTIDEIVFLNLFMQIPKPNGDGTAQCFLPYVKQTTRKMDKTDKHQYSTDLFYVDYSSFSYTRQKFEETYVDFWSIVPVEGGGYEKQLLIEGIALDDILTGNSPLPDIVISEYRYTQEEGQPITGALGFASQADDYVQALEVVHNNEEFLTWQMPTPTWSDDEAIDRESSPFTFTATEVSHSKKPADKGD